MAEPGACIVVGVGPGLGAALARCFGRAGHAVAVAARSMGKLASVVDEIDHAGGTAKAYKCDAADEASVVELFAKVEQDLGAVEVAVFNASGRVRRPVAEIGAEEFKDAWLRGCFGGFLVGREATRRMLPRGRGSIFFTGATASVKGFALSAGFAVPKFGLRALAESMARELQPKGIHVAHFVIDGGIGKDEGDARLLPDAIAETYYQTHLQHRSAWSLNVEVRPWVEKF